MPDFETLREAELEKKPLETPEDTIEELHAKYEKMKEENEILKQKLALIQQQELTKEKIKAILSGIEGFEFLNRVVDLGEPTKKRPKEIPLSKKWDVQAYPKEWEPEDKARAYLTENWMNYDIHLSYFQASNIGSGFFKYLIRNNITYLLPTACEQEMKLRLEEMK